MSVTFRLLCEFVVLSLERHRILHVHVIPHPTAASTAQQMVAGCPRRAASVLDPRSQSNLLSGVSMNAAACGDSDCASVPHQADCERDLGRYPVPAQTTGSGLPRTRASYQRRPAPCSSTQGGRSWVCNRPRRLALVSQAICSQRATFSSAGSEHNQSRLWKSTVGRDETTALMGDDPGAGATVPSKSDVARSRR